MVWELREGNEKQAGPGKGRIRPAEESDLSRIGEIFVFNNRMYYWPIFQDDEYSFNVMQVVPVINAYFGKEENRKRIFVYDDGLVKGFCELGEKEIRKLLVFFDGVDTLDAHNINWNIQYDRNNQTYRMIIEICRFVLKGLLQTTADGSTRIMDYADDMTMAKLYEKFILGYYQREHPDIRAYSPQIAWQVTDGYRTLLPTMQSDIVLSNKKTGKTLIIDAKFYTHNMQMKAPYMTQTLHSGNLYQIFTYVKNWDAAPGETVAGMLLYAKTDDAVQPDGDYQMSGNQISVKTLDMNCEFAVIAGQLDMIAEMVRR